MRNTSQLGTRVTGGHRLPAGTSCNRRPTAGSTSLSLWKEQLVHWHAHATLLRVKEEAVHRPAQRRGEGGLYHRVGRQRGASVKNGCCAATAGAAQASALYVTCHLLPVPQLATAWQHAASSPVPCLACVPEAQSASNPGHFNQRTTCSFTPTAIPLTGCATGALGSAAGLASAGASSSSDSPPPPLRFAVSCSARTCGAGGGSAWEG